MSWYVDEDSSDLCYFEPENGRTTATINQEQDEARHALLFIMRERSSLVGKLNAMFTLRESLLGHEGHTAQTECKYRLAKNNIAQEVTNESTHLDGGHIHAKVCCVDSVETEEISGQTEHEAAGTEQINASARRTESESSDVINELTQTNKELQQPVHALQIIHYCPKLNGCSQTLGCDHCLHLKATLVRFTTRVRKLERAARTRQGSPLTERLGVMTRKTKLDAKATVNGMSETNNNETESIHPSPQTDGTSLCEADLQRGRDTPTEQPRPTPAKRAERRGPPGLCEEPVLKQRLEDAERELKEVNVQLDKTSSEKAKLCEEIEDMKSQHFKELTLLRIQINKLDQTNKQYQDMVAQLQGKEHSYKQDMDQVLLQARSMVERERQEKYASLAEQKSLRQQVENLSTTMKSLQVKNDDMIRFQCDQDEEVDDYRRLKKLIHENGLPTVDQLIALRRQNETYREDFMNERKEKERVLSLKDKLKRDLDNAQSRISSLQEQVYKYREHIYFLQQKNKQDPNGPPSSPLFEQPMPSAIPSSPLAVANKLYGSSAPQYINETLLHGPGAPKYPVVPFDGKKPVAGKHGDGPGKPWAQFQQAPGNPGRFGRQMPEDWKRGYPPGHWSDNVFSPPQSRLGSASSLSSQRSGSSSSEEVGEGTGHERGPFGGGPRERGHFGSGQPDRPPYNRRQGPRPTLTDRMSDSDGRQMQQYGPPGSHFEAWSKPNYQHGRMHRQYSSPCGNGLRSPNPDYWSAGPNVAGFQRPWQSSPDHPAVQEASVPTSSGLRPTAEPWPPMARNGQSDNTSVTSAEEEPSLYIPGVSGIS